MADLKSIGCTVYDLDPDTGKQINFAEMGSHFSGSLDAIVIGFPEAPKTWHVVECKTMSTKVFNKLCKEGVKKTKPEHYAQMQTYCRWSGLDRAMYLVVCKENDDIYQERVYYDKTFALQLQDKARRVIFADEPLERASDNAGNFKCRYCEHKPICWEDRLPEVSCRTCAHITPIEDETKTSPFENGIWYCSRREKNISAVDQKRACDQHIFIPAMVPLEVTDADADKGLVTYAGMYVNGPGRMASIDLQKLIDVGGERCSGNSDRSRPFAPQEPDMSGVAYETEFIPQ